MAHIIIPKNVEDLIKLGMLIYKKHELDGDASPLRVQQDYNWTQNGPNLPEALELHLEAEELDRQAEQKREERNLLMGPIGEAIKSSRDLLKGVHRSQPRKLGDWGFEVNNTRNGGGDTPE